MTNAQERRPVNQTVVGGAEIPVEMTTVEAARLKRRQKVQEIFACNTTKDAIMDAMSQWSVSVTELAQAMDYKLDAIAHLRSLGVPDGFMGLKVWPQAEVDKYYAWQAKTKNALNIKVEAPPMYMVQQVMDREFSNNALNPAHAIPWH